MRIDKTAVKKFKLGEEHDDSEYWATKTMEECFEATCFLVEQYIGMNNLLTRMDKTAYGKINKHKEWGKEKNLHK